MSADEQAVEVRATPCPSKTCVVSPRDGFRWTYKSSQQLWQLLHTDSVGLLHQVCMGQGFTIKGSTACGVCIERGAMHCRNRVALLSWLYPCDVTACINIISLVHVFPFPFLSQLFYLMGLPTVMTTDQGKEFHNRVNDELMKVFGIKHRLTTAYHPQANGLDERLNQTLINSLANLAQEDHTMWDKNLLEVVYAYNTVVQDSSKFTPFEAMFGRVAHLPVDFIATTNYDADAKVKEFVDLQMRKNKSSPQNARRQKMPSKKTSRWHKGSRRCTTTEVQCCILLQCWVSSPEEGLHSEEASRRKAGLPVGRTLCDLIITWKRSFLIEGA